MRSLVRAIAIAAALSCSIAAAPAETLTAAFGDVPQGLDGDAVKPYTLSAVVQIYEPLVRYVKVTDSDGKTKLDLTKFEGGLATSWTSSEDGKRWVFKLREGVKSPYGNELTAADVVWSVEKSFAQKRTGNFMLNIANVASVEEVSKYEVAYNLRAPTSLLLPVLTLYVPGIYDSKVMKSHATPEDPWALKFIENHSAGFGPYHLDSITPGQQATFVFNPNYYGKRPAYDRVVIRAVPSSGSRLTLLRGGQVHYIERPTFQQVLELQKSPGIKVNLTPGKFFAALWFNTREAPFDDVRVRLAINHAINIDAVRKTLFHDYAAEAGSVLASFIPGATKTTYAYDPAKAKALLAEAGKSNLSFELVYSDSYSWTEQAAILIQGELKKVGVDVKLRRMTNNELRSEVSPGKRKLPAVLWEEGSYLADPVYGLSIITTPGAAANRNDHGNPAVTELVEKSKLEFDDAKRLALSEEAQKLLMADAPYVLLGFPNIVETTSDKVSGYIWYPDDYPRWADFHPKGK